MSKIKICGITNKDDAVWAINYGADFLGLNFYKESPRHVSVTSMEPWVPKIPSFTKVVGVFVNHSEEDVVQTVETLNLKGVQLHGQETPEFISSLRLQLEGKGLSVFIIKAFNLKSEEDIAQISAYKDFVDYFLLDTKIAGEFGGTGQTFNWNLVEKVKPLGKPIILAGGLHANNVKSAIKQTEPYAVDVASSIEKNPRKKDHDKMKAFIYNAK